MRWLIKAVAVAWMLPCAVAWAQSEPADDIEVTALGVVNPFEVGIDSALPEAVWSSGYAGALEAALIALPDSQEPGWSSQPAARLALRALRSAGEPPMATDAAFALAAKRADRLLAAGTAQLGYELLSRTPRVNESDALSRIFSDTAFAVGRTEEACRAANALLEGREAPYWLRVRAACLALDGAIPAAELTAELARAQAPNDTFDALFDAYVLGREAPADISPRTGLELTLMVALAPDVRIRPAEDAPGWLHKVAERTGPQIALPSNLPEALEAAVALDGEERAVALGALIYQDFDRELAAEALAIRLSDAAEQGRFVETAMAYGQEVASLPVTENTLAHGVAFVLAALIVDDVNAAEDWREALMDGPPAPAFEPILEPGADFDPQIPASLTPPPGFSQPIDQTPWEPPAAGVMVAIDFARSIALDQVDDDGFMALLAARIENATPERLCQAGALVSLGADDQGQLRQALSGLSRDENAPHPALGPVVLAAGAGALAETQLHAALLLERHPDDAEVCAAASLALHHAGLRRQALLYVLERVIEETA